MSEQSCTFEKCRFNLGLQCTVPEEYEKCSRGNIFTLTEKVYEKYPHDRDVWILLQEVVRIGQAVRKFFELSKEVSELHGKVEKVLIEMEKQKAGGQQEDESVTNIIQHRHGPGDTGREKDCDKASDEATAGTC